MRYSSAILAFAATAAAAPLGVAGGPDLCPDGLFSNPQCCATDVLGAIGLNCDVAPTTPTGTNDFIDICSAAGQQAKCCVIPVAGQALLCQDVNPGAGDGNPAPPVGTATATATGPGGGPGGPGSTGAPGGGPSSSPCDSSAVPTAPAPTAPAPSMPAPSMPAPSMPAPSAPAPPAPSSTDCGC